MLTVLEKIIEFLQFEMTEPEMYGWYHILCLFVMLLTIVALSFKKLDTKKLLLCFSIIMIVLEVYKQLSFSYSGGKWDYQWYAFPFQFCSVPMYISFIAALTKSKKLEEYLYAFLATYSLVAGISVMAYPETVFIPEVLIDVQTMVHHGLMVVIGFYMLYHKVVEYKLKTLFKGLAVFVVLVAIAVTVNTVTYHIGLDGGLEWFYISPYHTSTLPVFNIIYDKVPYVVFLFLYVFAFTVGGAIPLGVAALISKISAKKKANRKKK